jgi:hypothetical protein
MTALFIAMGAAAFAAILARFALRKAAQTAPVQDSEL